MMCDFLDYGHSVLDDLPETPEEWRAAWLDMWSVKPFDFEKALRDLSATYCAYSTVEQVEMKKIILEKIEALSSGYDRIAEQLIVANAAIHEYQSRYGEL